MTMIMIMMMMIIMMIMIMMMMMMMMHQVPHCLHRDLQICAGAPLLSGGDLGPEEDI